ncbi:TonB-dependent receptor [Arcticibacter tournemirensis]
MYRKTLPLIFIMLQTALLRAQENPGDTTNLLRSVVINAYFGSQPALTMPSTISVVTAGQIEALQPHSLLPAMNAVPGVRMEERSPGSYRLSIRGSLLRAPFGIRNIKMYLDDFLLTDAGGNTYFGSLDAGGIGRLEILKGPEASVFGANTGGVILIGTGSTAADGDASVKADIGGGSYGLFRQSVSLRKSWKQVSLDVSQAWQRSDGYRENSGMDRKYIHAVPRWAYSEKGSVKVLLLYTDTDYHTPGGLTEMQVSQNRRAARPASGPNPGAAEQKAGIMNTTSLGGIAHEYRFSDRLRHVVSFTGSHTDFKNPFITNYEVRDENTAGLRTYFELKGSKQSVIPWQGQVGFEAQRTGTDISNFGNRQGVRDTLQAADGLTATQKFAFVHLLFNLTPKLVVEMAGSLNFYNYKYAALQPATPESKKTFKEQLMPRLAFSYLLSTNVALRASASRGYSPPTIAEVRASDNIINTALQPERGWNYETGLRLSFFNNRLYWDGVVFNLNLDDAIVRRLNDGGNEFFVNAGTRQTGVESQILCWIIPPGSHGIITGLQLGNAYTFNSFYFRNYSDAGNDYTGNRLTGVPRHILVNSLSVQFTGGFYLNGQHNFTSSLPLNDAGTVYARSYHLVQLKAGLNRKLSTKYGFSIYAGADNLLNQEYSLGNDLNAFRDRYFNPAPGRNFFAGISAQF